MAEEYQNAAGKHAVNHQSGGSDPITGLVTNGDSHDHSGGDGAPIQSTTIAIHQDSHGLSINNPVKLSSSSYAKAKADSAANAEVVGIVSAVADVDNFTLLTEGRFTSTGHGLTVDAVYFLSASSAGALTATEPSTAGQISKPLVYVIDANTLYFHNWRGVVVGSAPGIHHTTHESGGSDAIKLDDLAAPDDNTDLDVSTSKHGLCPKAPNDTSKYLRGDGTWAAPSGGSGVPTGCIMMWLTNTAPSGWLIFYGQNISRTTYADLFAVWGTTFGSGDGSTTFGTPDPRGRGWIGCDNIGGSSANVVTAAAADTIGGTGGEENHTLTTAELASHTHPENHSRTYPWPSQEASYKYDANDGNYRNYSITGEQVTKVSDTVRLTTDTAGSDTAHNNMPPYMACYFIVKT